MSYCTIQIYLLTYFNEFLYDCIPLSCVIQGDTEADLDRQEIIEVILDHHTEGSHHLLDADLGKAIEGFIVFFGLTLAPTTPKCALALTVADTVILPLSCSELVVAYF